MGVAGSGKTTLGRLVSEAIGGTFIDADSFHTREAISNMKDGIPLTEEIRKKWLMRLFGHLSSFQKKDILICACSALSSVSQNKFKSLGFYTVFLEGDYITLEKRIKDRQGHFFPHELLLDQLKKLKKPDADLILNIKLSPDKLVRELLKHIITE